MKSWLATILTIAIMFGTAIITGLLTVISSKGGLHDGRRIWYNRITKRGWSIVSYVMAIMLLGVSQFLITDAKDEYKSLQQSINDSISRKQQYINDSIQTETTIREINQGVDSATSLIYKNLSEALAKQMLKFDTTKKVLVDLKDSIRNVAVEEPIMSIPSSTGISLQKVGREYLISIAATSENSSLKIIEYKGGAIVTKQDGSQTRIRKQTLMQTGETIAKGKFYIARLKDTTSQEIIKIEVGVKAKYQSNSNPTKILVFEDVIIVDYLNVLASGSLDKPFMSRWFTRNADLF